jgi:hypothetical protein
MTRARHWVLRFAIAACTACTSDASPVAPTTPAIRLSDIIIHDVAAGDVAYSHGDHWHGALRLGYGEARPFRMLFVPETQASHDAPDAARRITLSTRPDLRLRLDFEDATIVRWVGDATSGTFVGQYPGATRVVFSVWHGATVLWRSPPVSILVRE